MHFQSKYFKFSQICDECRPFVLKPESNLDDWWTTCKKIATKNQKGPIQNNPPEKKMKTDNEHSDCDDNTYIRVIQFLLMFSRCSRVKAPNIHTRGGASAQLYEDMKSLGNVDNRVLWTNNQFRIIRSISPRVFFNSTFGTGKTLLLQSKCLEVANADRNTKAYYIVMPAIVEEVSSKPRTGDIPKLETLIEHEAKRMFKTDSKFQNAIVMTWSDLAKEIPEKQNIFAKLKAFVQKNGTEASFFIDEYHEGYWEPENSSRLPQLVIFY